MSKKTKTRIIAAVILFGILMMIFGGIMYAITGNYWWRYNVCAPAVLVMASPLFIGLIYVLSCLAFGIKSMDDKLF